MRYGLGVDLGAATTVAAAAEGDSVAMIPLGVAGRAASVVAVGGDGVLVTGDRALAVAAGQLARGPIRRLGDPTPILLGGRAHTPSELLAAIARDTLAAATRHRGAAPSAVVVTAPSVWGPFRRRHLEEAFAAPGVPRALVVADAQAIAVRYGGLRPEPGRTVVVYDLGAATFDTAVLRSTADGWELPAPGEGTDAVSGDVLDLVVLSMAGGAPDMERDLPPDRLAAARERLSDTPSTGLPLPDGGTASLARTEFERRAEPLLEATLEAVHRALAAAGVDPGDVDEILLAGGVSRTPMVRRRLEAEFGRPVRQVADPENAAAVGAAMLAAAGLPAPLPSPAGGPVADEPPARPARPRGRGSRRAVLAGALAAAGVAVAAAALSPGSDPRSPAATTPAPAPSTSAPPAAAPPAAERRTVRLLVDDFSGTPAYPGSALNDLGVWTGANSFRNGGGAGAVTGGALRLSYDNLGWFGTDVPGDVGTSTHLVLRIKGARGGEESHFHVQVGGVTRLLADYRLDDGSRPRLTTRYRDISIPLAANGIDRSRPAQVAMGFWYHGAGEITIDAIGFG